MTGIVKMKALNEEQIKKIAIRHFVISGNVSDEDAKRLVDFVEGMGYRLLSTKNLRTVQFEVEKEIEFEE